MSDEIVKLRKFVVKWSGKEHQTTRKKMFQRSHAYRLFFQTGKNLIVEYGVNFYTDYNQIGKLTIGDSVLFARDVEIDISGDLLIGDKTSFSEGAKVLTHYSYSENIVMSDANEDMPLSVYGEFLPSPLEIEDHVWVGARAIIMPGVKKIGRSAIIGAEAVVEHEVPPYAVVKGNPAKIVGFRYSPKAVAKKEIDLYPPEARIPLEVLQENYDKVFKRS